MGPLEPAAAHLCSVARRQFGSTAEGCAVFLCPPALAGALSVCRRYSGPRGETGRCHVQQDVGTIHPVDMGDHGVKAMGGHLLKTEMLLDTFMKKFYSPAHPIPC